MESRRMIEEIKKIQSQGKAIGAFNIFDYISAKAVISAAEERKTAVILQTSVSTVKYYGARGLREMLRYLMDTSSVSVFLHLDHCKEKELAMQCVDAGWDSVMVDLSELPINENMRITREVAEYAHRRGVLVEGELGRIKGVEEEAVEYEERAPLDACIQYMKESRADLFAPAIGTAHGIYKERPEIDFEFCRKVSGVGICPVVCHGGSGLPKEIVKQLIASGITKINISTALKQACCQGIKRYMATDSAAFSPVDMEREVSGLMKAEAGKYMDMFSGE